MAFWKLGSLQLEEFRPGIMSKAEIGDNLIMVCMQISKGKEDTGHEHSFDQCGIVLEGQIVKKKGSQQLTKGVYQSLWEKKQENKIDSGSVEY